MATGHGLTEIVEALEKGRKLQRGAWNMVIETGRKYALVKAQGVVIDRHGCRVRVAIGTQDDYTEQFKRELLDYVEAAFAEDAHMGAVLASNLEKG